MQKSKLTVFYDGFFWVGVYERIQEGKLEACKITFGAEPKDYEVYDFILQNWDKLRFSPPVEADEGKETRVNPKRMQRDIKKQLETHGTGTKSQQALSLQREQQKKERRIRSREEKEAEREQAFLVKQQKRKEKHRGR